MEARAVVSSFDKFCQADRSRRTLAESNQPMTPVCHNGPPHPYFLGDNVTDNSGNNVTDNSGDNITTGHLNSTTAALCLQQELKKHPGERLVASFRKSMYFLAPPSCSAEVSQDNRIGAFDVSASSSR